MPISSLCVIITSFLAFKFTRSRFPFYYIIILNFILYSQASYWILLVNFSISIILTRCSGSVQKPPIVDFGKERCIISVSCYVNLFFDSHHHSMLSLVSGTDALYVRQELLWWYDYLLQLKSSTINLHDTVICYAYA